MKKKWYVILLEILTKVLPAFLFLYNKKNKNRIDSLESKLDLQKIEVKIEKAKRKLVENNRSKSNITIIREFINRKHKR